MLREYQENAGNGQENDSVLKVIVVVSSTMRISVQNRHQCPLLPLNHRQKKMVNTIREEGVLEAAVISES